MRRIDSILTLGLLGVTASVLIIGELLGGPDLSIVKNFISDFAARSNLSGTLVNLAMWGFGLTYLSTAAMLLRLRMNSEWVRLGCLCLAASAALLPFVSEYRLWVPPTPQHHHWMFLDSVFGSKPPEEPPDASVREEVHGNLIKASMLWVVAGMIFVGIGIGTFRLPKGVGPSIASWSLAVAAFLLFRGCQGQSLEGLIEWMAFLCIGVWVIAMVRFGSSSNFQ